MSADYFALALLYLSSHYANSTGMLLCYGLVCLYRILFVYNLSPWACKRVAYGLEWRTPHIYRFLFLSCLLVHMEVVLYYYGCSRHWAEPMGVNSLVIINNSVLCLCRVRSELLRLPAINAAERFFPDRRDVLDRCFLICLWLGRFRHRILAARSIVDQFVVSIMRFHWYTHFIFLLFQLHIPS